MLPGDLVKCKWGRTMSYMNINGHFFTAGEIKSGEVFVFVAKTERNIALCLRFDGQIRYAYSEVFERI